MEIILALAVVIAVIIFGALISMGNERQRRAIDGLREQVVLWAIQDLRIKREKLASEVQINNPLTWLNKVTTNSLGCNMQLQTVEFFESPAALVCAAVETSGKLVFSPLSPKDLRRMKKERKNRLVRFTQDNPLISLPRDTEAYEISALNSGLLFDLELPLAWKSLTGQDIGQSRIWFYVLE